MRYERLVIEGGGASYSLDFHPQLTVIAGLGQIERDGIVNEMIGALGATRAGVHAEIVSDSGHQFAVFRPLNAHHRVISVDTARDVSDRFRNENGEIDILARAGLDTRTARQRCRLGAGELRSSGQIDLLLAQLATKDAGELYLRANAAVQAEAHLRDVAEATGAQPEDARIVQQVEDRHNEFLGEQHRAERTRRITFGVAALLALAGLGMALRQQPVAAGLMIIVASLVAGASLRKNNRLAVAEQSELEALAAAGAQSYLGFHLQRVDGLLADDHQRRQLVTAAENAQSASESWESLVGKGIDASWALEQREHIECLRGTGRDLPTQSFSESSHAKLLRSRLDDLQTGAAGGESLPLILDDAFSEIEREHRPALLELLVERSRHQQVVFLTSDDELATWARLEALAGGLAIVEPIATNAHRQTTVAA